MEHRQRPAVRAFGLMAQFTLASIGLLALRLLLTENDLVASLRLVAAILAGTALLAVGIYANDLAARRIRRLTVVTMALLSVATVLDGIDSLNPLQLSGRVSLFTHNANLLGAALALGGTASYLALSRHRMRYILMAFIALAIMFTGSRASLLALVAPLLLWEIRLLYDGWRSKEPGTMHTWLQWFTVLIAFLIAASYYAFNLADSNSTDTNLLLSSNDLTHASWDKRYSKVFEVTHSEYSSPTGQEMATRLSALPSSDSPIPGLVVMQGGIGPAEEGVTYVASVYLRSDIEQELIVSTNYTHVICRVSSQWQRCITPPAIGNGRTDIQFQLRSKEPGLGVLVDLWGAQLEYGESPSPVRSTRSTVFSELNRLGYLARLTPSDWIDGESTTRRRRLQAEALAAFISSPITGVGIGRVPEWVNTEIADYEDFNHIFTHAHNYILQLLAEVGLIGLSATILPLVGVAIIGIRQRSSAVIPLLLTVGILNTFDYTYWHVGSYYTTWLWLGLALRPLSRNASS